MTDFRALKVETDQGIVLIDQQVVIIVLIVAIETPIIPLLGFAIAVYPYVVFTLILNQDSIVDQIMISTQRIAQNVMIFTMPLGTTNSNVVPSLSTQRHLAPPVAVEIIQNRNVIKTLV